MKLKTMTKNLLIGLALSSTFSVFAQSELNQQLSLAQDSINRLVNDMSSRQSSSTLNLRDYHKWESNFKMDMEVNFNEYETKLRQRIFGPLQEIIGRYDKIQKDKNMPQDQKKNILDSIIEQIGTMKPSLEQEYAKLLNDLYHSNNVFPKALNTIASETTYYTENGREVKKPRPNGQNTFSRTFQTEFHQSLNSDKSEKLGLPITILLGEQYRDAKLYYDTSDSHSTNWTLIAKGEGLAFVDRQERLGNFSPFAYFLSRMSYDSTHHRIIKGCESKACILIKSSDITYLFQSIRSMLDQDIVISLAYIQGQSPKTITIKSLALKIKQFTDILKRTDYPTEVANLPYDI